MTDCWGQLTAGAARPHQLWELLCVSPVQYAERRLTAPRWWRALRKASKLVAPNPHWASHNGNVDSRWVHTQASSVQRLIKVHVSGENCTGFGKASFKDKGTPHPTGNSWCASFFSKLYTARRPCRRVSLFFQSIPRERMLSVCQRPCQVSGARSSQEGDSNSLLRTAHLNKGGLKEEVKRLGTGHAALLVDQVTCARVCTCLCTRVCVCVRVCVRACAGGVVAGKNAGPFLRVRAQAAWWQARMQAQTWALSWVAWARAQQYGVMNDAQAETGA